MWSFEKILKVKIPKSGAGCFQAQIGNWSSRKLFSIKGVDHVIRSAM
jgi:hypothetical protein